jgi:hypothetical protein
MAPVGFEPTISEGERSKTNVLDRAATGTGNEVVIYQLLMVMDGLKMTGIGLNMLPYCYD